MKAQTIIEASDIHELKTLGSYHKVKKSIEGELGNKLGVTGWKSLFEKIKSLKEIIANNKEYLLAILNKKTFKESKAEISKILNLDINARSWSELEKKTNLIINVFCSGGLDPYEYYEKTKLKKFRNSSKLEGIDIEFPDENTTLESVLAKYRR